MRQTRKHGRGTTLTLTLGIAILGCSLGGKAAEGQELVTDRPDFTESAIVIPAKTVQIESGFTWIDESTSEALSGPEVLVRWGLSERLELRIGLPDWVDPRGGSSGVGDSSIGAKFQFGPTDNGDPHGGFRVHQRQGRSRVDLHRQPRPTRRLVIRDAARRR